MEPMSTRKFRCAYILRLMIPVVCQLTVSAHADSTAAVAMKGGVNADTLAEEDQSERYGISGGVGGYLRWPLGDRFSLATQMDVLYTPRGAEKVFEGRSLGKTRLHYFDVTLAARPEVRFGPVSVYVLLGAGLNFLASARQVNASGGSEDLTDKLRRVDVELLAGAGVSLYLPRMEMGPLSRESLFLEARHDHGLIDTDKINGGYKNRNSSLMLGLSLTH